MRSARHRPPRRRKAPLVIAVALAVGCGSWGWMTREAVPLPAVASAPVSSGTSRPDPGAAATPSPTRSVSTPEQDTAFVQDVVVLQAQTVLLAHTLRGSDPDVAALAQRIRDEQDPDVRRLVAWLQQEGAEVPAEVGDPTDADVDAHPGLPGGITSGQLDALQVATGSDADRLFLGLLLSNDEGALKMARTHAGETGDDGLRTLADAVERSRSTRCDEVMALLERLT